MEINKPIKQLREIALANGAVDALTCLAQTQFKLRQTNVPPSDGEINIGVDNRRYRVGCGATRPGCNVSYTENADRGLVVCGYASLKETHHKIYCPQAKTSDSKEQSR